MDIRYTTDLNHRYMLIKSPEEPADSYDVRILMTNEIPGVLRLDREAVNDERFYRYEITGYRALQDLLKENALKETDIRRFLKNLFWVLSDFEAWLLDPDHLLISAEHLFVDPDRLMPGMIYLPFRNESLRRSLGDLARILMLQQDDRDSRLIVMLCHLMQDLEDDVPFFELRSRLLESREFSSPEPFAETRPKEEMEAQDDEPLFIDEASPGPYSSLRPAGDLDDEWRMGELMRGPDTGTDEDGIGRELLPEKGTVRIACIAIFPAALIFGALQLQSWFYLTPSEIAGAVLGTAAIMLLAGVWREKRRASS